MTIIPPRSKLSSAPSSRIHARSQRRLDSSRSSFAVGASSLSATSRKGAGTNGNAQEAQIYLDGLNVTPQSLLLRRVDPIGFSSSSVSFASSRSQPRKRVRKTRSRTRQSHLLKSLPSRTQSECTSSKGSLIENDNTSESSDESVLENAAQRDDPSAFINEPKSDPPVEMARDLKVEAETFPSEFVSSPISPLKSNRKLHAILFTETPTDFLLSLPSVRVPPENISLSNSVRQRNARYRSMCSAKKGSDTFVSGRSQTLQFAQKTKEVMTAPPATRDAACIATHWDIFDTETRLKSEVDVPLRDFQAPIDTDATLKLQVNEIMHAMLASSACLLDLEHDIVQVLELYHQQSGKPTRAVSNTTSRKQFSGDGKAVAIRRKKSNASQNSQNVSFNTKSVSALTENSGLHSRSSSRSTVVYDSQSLETRDHAYAHANPNADLGEIIATQKTSRLMASTSLSNAICILERAVQQNVFYAQQLLYRNLSFLRPSKAFELQRLWAFRCDQTQRQTVTSMSWNTANHDLVAVGYMETHAVDRIVKGSVLFWTLSNPEHPERTYDFSIGVSSLDFSSCWPYLLAVGFIDGVVAVYDVRKRFPEFIASSANLFGKHLDAVWQVKWVQKGSDANETIVSISADGRVTEWNRKKGLSFTDLMALKHVANPFLGSNARAEGVISRQASGLSFDFMKSDTSVYFVGTEDGLVHKCSVSYNEQYLSTYLGHAGPVYRVATSPFSSNVFLTCSADWSVKLWHHAEALAIANFQSMGRVTAVHDVCWCPNDATIFAIATEDGRVEIWDIESSVLDPIATCVPREREGGRDEREEGKEGRHFECVRVTFAPKAPVVVVGDTDGNVALYRVETLAEKRIDANVTEEEQKMRLHRAIRAGKAVL